MASKDSSIGLSKIEIGDVKTTGLPTTWEELHDVKIGTALFSESEPTVNEIFVEQRASVYRSITSQEGVITLSFELYDVSPANIARLKGGTVANGTWKSSVQTVTINKSVRVTTLDGYQIVIPNGKVVSTFNWVLSKEELASIAVTITAQAPLDATLAAVEIKAPTTTGA